jgi:hypothetical protein
MLTLSLILQAGIELGDSNSKKPLNLTALKVEVHVRVMSKMAKFSLVCAPFLHSPLHSKGKIRIANIPSHVTDEKQFSYGQ